MNTAPIDLVTPYIRGMEHALYSTRNLLQQIAEEAPHGGLSPRDAFASNVDTAELRAFHAPSGEQAPVWVRLRHSAGGAVELALRVPMGESLTAWVDRPMADGELLAGLRRLLAAKLLFIPGPGNHMAPVNGLGGGIAAVRSLLPLTKPSVRLHESGGLYAQFDGIAGGSVCVWENTGSPLGGWSARWRMDDHKGPVNDSDSAAASFLAAASDALVEVENG